jgi:hypothetical protein
MFAAFGVPSQILRNWAAVRIVIVVPFALTVS